MKTHADYLQHFIKKHHLSQPEWLTGDASTRKYARVYQNQKSYILMDSPQNEKPKEFYQIAMLLRRYDIAAPKIYAKDLRHGFMLMEDFGDTHMSTAVKKKSQADELYILAIDTLIKIQKYVTKTDLRKVPPSMDFMLQENNYFIEYYVNKVLNISLSDQAKQQFHQIWDKLLHTTQQLPQTLMLYDYHADNLMVKSDGKLGLLDFQDAMQGPIFYDLVSLLEDERHPLPTPKRKLLLKHFFELRPVLATPKYAGWLDVIAAHRHTRVLGRFGLLATKYHKKSYLKYAPNAWIYLRENTKNPLLKDYRAWLKKYLPIQFKGDK